jgi:hypothetical protein
MSAVRKTEEAPQADTRRPETTPGTAIRWQAEFYRSYLTDALQRLAADPNPDVQRIGQEMNKCLSCPSTERCSDCPFNRGAANTVRGLNGARNRTL